MDQYLSPVNLNPAKSILPIQFRQLFSDGSVRWMLL